LYTFSIAKIDEIKELLNTLRTVFGMIVAVVLTITAGLIKMYYSNQIDILFYIGSIFDLLLVFCLPIIAKYIVKNIKKLKDL